MKFVVYEVWTTSRIIEAEDALDASMRGSPPLRPGLNLCNWHIVPVPEVAPPAPEKKS